MVETSFTVHYCPPGYHSGPSCQPCLTDFALFEEILRINGDSSPRKHLGTICSSYSRFIDEDPQLRETLELLAKVGWKPIYSILRANQRQSKEFLVKRYFIDSDPIEIKKAEFLCGWPTIYGGWGERLEGDTIVAKTTEEKEARKRSEVVFLPGNVRETGGAWSQKAADAVISDGLVGATFKPIIWESKWNRAVKQPYYLVSEICFPRSLTPRCVGADLVDEDYLAKHGEPDKFEWDDEARHVARMFYRRSDLNQMKGIDIASTFEHFSIGGPQGQVMPARMIYSQRFRKWANRMGYKFRWQPIVVIED